VAVLESQTHHEETYQRPGSKAVMIQIIRVLSI
jgi:hypothetical protein